jgi:uncharacterized membrane protein
MVETYIVGTALILIGLSFFGGWYKLNRVKSYLLISSIAVISGIMAFVARYIWTNPDTIAIVRSTFNILIGLSWIIFFVEEIIQLRRNNNERKNS